MDPRVILFFAVFAHVFAFKSDVEEVSHFVAANGGSQVSIFAEKPQQLLALELKRALSHQTRFVRSAKLDQSEKLRRSNFNVAIVESANGLNESFHLMNNFTAKSFLLYFPRNSVSIWKTEFKKLIQRHNLNLLFYVGVDEEPTIKWFYTMLIKESSFSVINQLSFIGNS